MTEILQFPDERLFQKSKKVTLFDQDLRDYVIELLSIMREQSAVGIASIQVGIPKNIFIVEVGIKPIIFINCMILKATGKQEVEEGCLSQTGRFVKRKRPAFVTCKFQDIYGTTYSQGFSGLAAQAIIHEHLHCQGKVPLDEDY